MPLFSNQLELNDASKASGTALADITAIKGAFKVFDTYSALTSVAVSRVSNNQIVWVEDSASLYDYIDSFTDTVSWGVFSGFGSGGSSAWADITSKPVGLISGSLQVESIVDDTYISASAALSGFTSAGGGSSVWADITSKPDGLVSGSIQTIANLVNSGLVVNSLTSTQTTASAMLVSDVSPTGDVFLIRTGDVDRIKVNSEGTFVLKESNSLPIGEKGGLSVSGSDFFIYL
jgi:hypothetical protein